MFQLMHDTGLSCRLRGDLRSHPLAVLYCLNCDPKQPKYVRNLPYFAMLTQDEFADSFPLIGFPSSRSAPLPYSCYNVTFGGSSATLTDFAKDPANLLTCFSTRGQQVLISREWVRSELKIEPNILSLFDTCMLQKNAPCLDLTGAIIPNRDRFMCGNDLVNPGRMFASDRAVCDLAGVAHNSTECKFIVTEKALNQDSFGTPQIDENFGFRLVEDRACTNDEYNTWVGLFARQGNGTDVFNPVVLNGPACLMTQTQVIDMNANVLTLTGGTQVNVTADFINANGEIAFSSASALVFPALLAFLFMALATLL